MFRFIKFFVSRGKEKITWSTGRPVFRRRRRRLYVPPYRCAREKDGCRRGSLSAAPAHRDVRALVGDDVVMGRRAGGRRRCL